MVECPLGLILVEEKPLTAATLGTDCLVDLLVLALIVLAAGLGPILLVKVS